MLLAWTFRLIEILPPIEYGRAQHCIVTKSIVMDEDTPDNIGTKNEWASSELAKLLREFLERELAELRLERENREMEVEEDILHVEQYGEDASDAWFDLLFTMDYC